jgi:hypothetical protein
MYEVAEITHHHQGLFSTWSLLACPIRSLLNVHYYFSVVKAFNAGDFEEALAYYNRSLKFRETVAARNNRAQAC